MWWLKSRCFGHPLQQVLSNHPMLPICSSLSCTASSFPVRNLSGRLGCWRLHCWVLTGVVVAAPSCSPQERDNDPEPSIRPVLGIPSGHHTLQSVLSSLRAFPLFFLKHMTFISFEEVSLNHSDFTFWEPHCSPDFLNFCLDHLIPPAPQLLPLRAAGIWQQLEMAFSLQQRFKQISPSFQYHSLSCRPRSLTGGNCLLISCSPSGAPWECQMAAEVSSEPGRAAIKFGPF